MNKSKLSSYVLWAIALLLLPLLLQRRLDRRVGGRRLLEDVE
jgi:hypothetical protein